MHEGQISFPQDVLCRGVDLQVLKIEVIHATHQGQTKIANASGMAHPHQKSLWIIVAEHFSGDVCVCCDDHILSNHAVPGKALPSVTALHWKAWCIYSKIRTSAWQPDNVDLFALSYKEYVQHGSGRTDLDADSTQSQNWCT